MSAEKNSASTRRDFLKGGALLAVPLTAAAPAAVMADDGLKARLARLEGERAIGELHQAWLRRVNSGDAEGAAELFADRRPARFALDENLRNIAPDHAAEPDVIDLAADGKSAKGQFHCAVEIAEPIAQDSTIARMAREQGGGFIRRTERRVLKVEYVKESSAWSIEKIQFAPTDLLEKDQQNGGMR